MEKRHPSQYEGDQGGCISGLINIFDFRHGRSTRRLLAERRRASKHILGSGHTSSTQTILPHLAETCETLVDTEEHKKMPMADVAKTSVKKLMEEEMLNEQSSNNQSDCCEMDLEKIDSKYLNILGNMDVSELDAAKCLMPENSYKVLEQKPSNDLYLKIIMQELEQINQESTEFIDGLQTVSSNKGLFLKLLHDQNHIQDLDNALLRQDQACSSFPAYKCAEEKPKDLKSDKFRHHNFFLRRSKSVGSYEDCQSSSNNIVILKPGSAVAQSPETDVNKVQNGRNVSQFSFTEIKRRLRQAMGISPDRRISPTHQNGNIGNEGATGEFGWSCPNRNHFYTERFAKYSTSFKSKDSGSAIWTESNIYIEAKKHLSETMTSQLLSESLGRILSFPDYSSSPKEHSGEIIRTSLISFCKNDMNEFMQENDSSKMDEEVECLNMNVTSPSKCEKEHSLEIQSFTEDSIVPEVSSSSSRVVEIQELTELRPQDGDTMQKGDIGEVDNDESASQCLKDSSLCFKSDLFEEIQILSSPPVSPTLSKEVEESECVTNKTERPSPVSVLEPLFTDDDINPPSTISHPEQSSTTNQEIICMRISLEDEESALEYLEAVLVGSGLNFFLDGFLYILNEVEIDILRPTPS